MCAALGFVLILVLCGAEAATPLKNFVNPDPMPSGNTGLKGVVEDLTAFTAPEDQVDSDGDGIYDKVEIIIESGRSDSGGKQKYPVADAR